jgi:4-amino-4-deoxy-L-arabinose transferase-like glycosyltransferase
VLGLAALAGLQYAWGAKTEVLEPYYAAGVRSMAASWHNFLYGAFDPAGTVTMDKLPGALWLQALSVRQFGVHVWALVLPQIVEGVLSVIVAYRAVRRLAGPVAGLVAAAVLVASPANVALDRGNISDSLLVLLAVLAADATGRALVKGHWWSVLETGLWVGLAFQAKMAQAWLVLVPITLTYLWFGPGRTGRRSFQLVTAGVVTAAVSLGWMVVVSLQPGAGRPYVDGSTTNSVWQQVFQYNGLGRFGGGGLLGPAGTPTAAAARLVPGLLAFTVRTPPGWHRLLSGTEGRDIGWLIPVALVAGLGALWSGARAARRARPALPAEAAPVAGELADTDRLMAAGAALWLIWLLVHLAVFSWATSINAYYAAILTPALAGLLGSGAALAWRRRQSTGGRVLLAGAVVGSAVYGLWLLHVPTAPGAIQLAVVGLAALAVVALLLFRRPGWVTVSALVTATAAVLAAPALSGVWLVDHHLGPFDTPYEPPATTFATQSASLQNSPLLSFTVNSLTRFDQGATYTFATHSSLVASPFIFATGREILPIGGFTGLAPFPTVAQLRADVTRGALRFVLANRSDDSRIQWVRTHCQALNPTLPGRQPAPLGLYLCTPAAAAGVSPTAP